jgi:hypothetical protein
MNDRFFYRTNLSLSAADSFTVDRFLYRTNLSALGPRTVDRFFYRTNLSALDPRVIHSQLSMVVLFHSGCVKRCVADRFQPTDFADGF